MQLSFWERADDVCSQERCAPNHRELLAESRGAEYLVAADLSFAGHDCFFAAEGLAYDLVLDAGEGIERIQVKSTAGVRIDAGHGNNNKRIGYVFDGRRSKNSRSRLNSYEGQADIFAFVARDLRLVMYGRVGDVPNRLVIPATRFTVETCRLSLVAVLSE